MSAKPFKRFIQITFTLCLCISLLVLLSSSGKSKMKADCSIFKKGTFAYAKKKNMKDAKVVIKCKTHTEYTQNGKYFVKSKIKWINDCEFNLTIKAATVPGFPFSVGDVMNVKIDSVKNKLIYTSYTTKNGTGVSLFRKVE